MDGGVRLWWEEVDETLCRLSADAIGAASFENLPEWLGPALGGLPGLADRRPAIRRLVDRMNALPGTERTRILDALRTLDGDSGDGPTDWNDVHVLQRELSAPRRHHTQLVTRFGEQHQGGLVRIQELGPRLQWLG